MPKLPGKFDDISKPASSVLGDDFQVKGYQLKTKQKTNLSAATCETTVDAFTADGQYAKLNFKFPKPFDFLDGLAIDKFELDKAGKAKVECNLTKALHGVDGLKIGVNPDLHFNAGIDLKEITYSATYTGMADTSVKVETKHFAPADFTAEAIRGLGDAAVGLKLNGSSTLCPAVGVNYQFGDIFASVLAKNTFSEFTCHAHYKVSSDMQVAATFQQGGKKNGDWSVAASAALGSDLDAKAKFESSNALSVAIKKQLAKGTTFFGGVSYNISKGDMTYGAKMSIE